MKFAVLWIVVVGGLLNGCNFSKEFDRNCELRGGIPYHPHKTRGICLKKESVIELGQE